MHCRLSLRSARSGPPPSACSRGERVNAKTNAPDSGVQVEKAKLQPQGSKEHPDFILVSPSVDLTESFPPSASRPAVVILTLPTSIILPPALLAGVSGSL